MLAVLPSTTVTFWVMGNWVWLPAERQTRRERRVYKQTTVTQERGQRRTENTQVLVGNRLNIVTQNHAVGSSWGYIIIK